MVSQDPKLTISIISSLDRGDDTIPNIYRKFGVENELVELPLCPIDDYIAELYNDIRIKAVLSSNLIEALARVTFDKPTSSEELRLRCRKIGAYLDISFPDLVFMQNPKVNKHQLASSKGGEDVKGMGQRQDDEKAEQGMEGDDSSPDLFSCADAWHIRDHALFLQPEDYRQGKRHVIFIDESLYNAIYSLKASQATGMFSFQYKDRHEEALRFFIMVCIVHELGHIVRTTFSQSTPDKHGCEAGFAVEKRVFGGEVVLVHKEEGVDKRWDDVVEIRFVHDSAGSRYLSVDDKDHPLWYHFDRCEINNIISHTRTSLRDYPEQAKIILGRTNRTARLSMSSSAKYTASTGHSIKTQGYGTRDNSAHVSPSCSIPLSDSTYDALELRIPRTDREKIEANKRIVSSRRGFKDVFSYNSG